jgi:hypothetical protein
VRGAACNGADHAGESPATAIARFGGVAVPDGWSGRPGWSKAQVKALGAERSDPSGGRANTGAAAESEHCSVETASHEKRVVGSRAAEPDSRMGEGQWILLKQRARASGVCSGAWMVAPANWSATQSREGLDVMRPDAQAREREAHGDDETGGSGRSSDDAVGQHNPGRAKNPWDSGSREKAKIRPDMPERPTGISGRVADSSDRRASNLYQPGQGAREGNVRFRCLEAVLGKTRRTEFQRGTMKRSYGAC